MVRLRFFATLLILDAIASESVAGIPVPWLGIVAAILGAVTVLPDKQRPKLPAFFCYPLLVYVLFASCLNLFNWLDYRDSMPVFSTTSYSLYIALRYVMILGYASMVLFVFYICTLGEELRCVKIVVNIGTIVAVYGLYTYFAQWIDLPALLPRSRIGTGGGEQAIVFSHSLHRALGSFREPSHLAEWLMLPFTLSFISNPKLFEPRKIVLAITIMVTGSMTATMSLIISYFFCGLILHSKTSIKSMASSFLVIVVVILLTVGISVILSQPLFEVFDQRISEILEGGIQASNRGFAYEYLATQHIPLIGDGLGNANLVFSGYKQNPLQVAFNSLYLNTMMSTGLLGLVIVGVLLAMPVIKTWESKTPLVRNSHVFYILWCYVAWLIDFGVHAEELPLLFGVTCGLLLFQIYKARIFSVNFPHSQAPVLRVHAGTVTRQTG